MKMKGYKFFSFILSPPMVAFYTITFFSLFSPIGLGNLDLFSTVLIGMVFLVLIPFGSIYYFSKEDIDVFNKEKREKIYLVVIISYLISSTIFWFFNSHIMFVISMTYVFVTTAVSIINLFWKISAHTAGIAGPTTALTYVFGTDVIPIFILTLLVVWVRLKLRAHNILQLMSGAIVAIFITLIVYFLLW